MSTEIVQIGKWVLRYRVPKQLQDARVLLMFHGWTGDENSMWVFARNLPENLWIIAPRGSIQTTQTGYGWVDKDAAYENYLQECNKLIGDIKDWFTLLNIDPKPFSVFGFSQGAAMALSLTLGVPAQIRSLICVAGFLPTGTALFESNLQGKPVYIAHGTQDPIIPVGQAQKMARFLADRGAEVTYCENDVGHKLSLGCYKGLEQFIIQNC